MNYQPILRSVSMLLPMAFLGLSVGCVEPNYRTEVSPTGQGGVDVHRVPKDEPDPGSAPSAPVASPSPQTVDEKIDTLEKQVRAKNAEIERLKQEKAAHPAVPQ